MSSENKEDDYKSEPSPDRGDSIPYQPTQEPIEPSNNQNESIKQILKL